MNLQRRRKVLTGLLLAALLATLASAQGRRRGIGGFRGPAPKMATPHDFEPDTNTAENFWRRT